MAGFETVVQPAALFPLSARSRGWLQAAFVRRAALILVSGAAVVGLLYFSLYLAAARIYQVDECSNVSAAYALASGHPRAGLDLFQMLLSRVLPATGSSVDLLVAARRAMTVVFWINWLFIAVATGERLLTSRWWLALLGAATLAPLWDYGFEVRHDNLLLAGVLLIWCAIRFGPPRTSSYFIVGVVACALQFTAVKAIVYTLPIGLALLIFPPPGRAVPRWKLAMAGLLGVLASWLVIRWLLGVAGVWADYMSGARAIAAGSVGADRHRYWWPTLALGRFVEEAPLISALVVGALVVLAMNARRNWRLAFTWDGILPEVFLFVIALVALLINPTPFLYNLVNLVPFAFLLAYRFAAQLAGRMGDRPELVPLIGCLLIFTHLVPFGVTTRRHLEKPNSRQERLMQLAESLTDPAKDPVFDAIGMVPTRPFVDDRAFIHTMDFRGSYAGPPIADMLAARPAAVVILNYRTDWLSGGVHALIRDRYVKLADDFRVLGTVLPPGGGQFEIFHAGRYRLAPVESSDLAGTHPDGFRALESPTNEPSLAGAIDGKPLTSAPVELGVGIHQLNCREEEQPTVVWVGPSLDRLPRIGQGDHTQLFVNGY